MISISLCMIIKNEEHVLERCLSSICDVVDEIIIVDTGSTDNSKNISKKYTNNIYDFQWIDDFSKARNYSFDKASKDYIMWLDADEYLDEINKEKLRNLKDCISTNIDVISMETYMYLDENKNPKIKSRRNRIVKASKELKWSGFVHEYIDIESINIDNIYDSSIVIFHDKIQEVNDRNLNIYLKNINDGKKLNSRDLYYYGKELYCHKMTDEAINILEEFIKKAIYKEEIVDALCKIGECYLNKKQYKNAREFFYKTFEYTSPRGDIICNIAFSFEEEKRYIQAINWYEIILNMRMPNDCNQCVNLYCWRFKPHLNLCCCYYELGDLNRAYYHHKKCMELNPQNECVKCNEKYFNSIIKPNE